MSHQHISDEDEQPAPDDIQETNEEPAQSVLVVLVETNLSVTNEPQDLMNQSLFVMSEHSNWSEETANTLHTNDNQMTNDNQTEDSFNEVFVGAAFPNSEPDDLDDTIPLEDTNLPVVVEVRRGFCLTDLMNAFGDPEIMNKEVSVKMKLPNGSFVKGAGSGCRCQC